ncbi:MAG TPA: glycosyltransferase family 9 protein [Candidatus Omnitrophota bacterium]|nr:glycosyltransferase family 9 protein [Candidatus Omnitrophota bacterium]HPD85249.1 glycosyltransferase family 9 protein [Candidatus Omnitrophota bacterium]HRZ04250.1 glycosyltransferase family 9 protein [Candidatus Omnitrophota bacterium]
MENIKIGAKEILASSGSPRMKLLKLFDFLVGSLLATLAKEREEKKFPPAGTVKRILVIRPGGIGDAIFLLPFLRTLRQENRELRVDILCEKRNAAAFESQKGICDNIYRYDKLDSFKALFGNRYDVVIDSEQWHYLSALVAYFLRPAYAIGFATRELRTKLFNQKIAYDIDAYEIVNFSRLFGSLLTNKDAIQNIDSCFIVSDDCRSWAGQKVQEKSVCLFLGASIPERRLTTEQSLTIARFIIENGISVILLGGGDVKEEARALEKNISGPRLINLVGQTSLEQSAALIKQSALFIGPDSGLMHLACAVGTPVVAIFGPGNLKKWGPKGSMHSVVSANASCAPCTVFGYTLPTCQGVYSCTKDVNMADTLAAIKKYTQ